MEIYSDLNLSNKKTEDKVMKLKLIGGLDKLNSRYKEVAQEYGFQLELMRKESKVKNVGIDEIVIYNTSINSHKTKMVLDTKQVRIRYLHNHSISEFKKLVMQIRAEIDAQQQIAQAV